MLFGALTIALVVEPLWRRQSGHLLQQAWQNVRFADQPSLLHAFQRYPKTWPPFYALLLRCWTWLGLPWARFNQLVFYATLALLAAALRKIESGAAAAGLLALFAIAHFNYVNEYQPTADALVGPLMLGLYLVLGRYLTQPAGAALAAITAATAALLLARYFDLVAVLPVAALLVWMAPAPNPRARVRRTAAMLLCAVLPIALWMGYAWRTTGYFTGADRREPRNFPSYLRYWSDLTTPLQDLRLWLKTLFLDFFSTRHPGVLAYVTHEYRPDPLEWLLLVLFAVCLGLSTVAAWRALRSIRASWRLATTSLGLAALLFGFYNLALIGVWSFANNDPLHSRYLWPAYPFLFVLALGAWTTVRRAWTGNVWVALPFRALFVLLFLVQLERSLLAVPVPVRYELDDEQEETLDLKRPSG